MAGLRLIVGLGNLGHALATYRGFAGGGFRVVGLIDVDPAVVGRSVACGDESITVRPLADLRDVARSPLVSPEDKAAGLTAVAAKLAASKPAAVEKPEQVVPGTPTAEKLAAAPPPELVAPAAAWAQTLLAGAAPTWREPVGHAGRLAPAGTRAKVRSRWDLPGRSDRGAS